MGQNLGQHFLKSHSVVTDIIEAADVSEDDTVLEIGPGKGVLTEALLEKAEKVVVVEKDPQLATYLKEKYAQQVEDDQLQVVMADVRDIDLSHYKLEAKNYKLAANIPYYITSEILRQFLTTEHAPISITLLVQKEVAERIMAEDGRESVLSLSVKVFGTPEIVRLVSKKHFSPPPKVDSAILHISNISRNFFTKNDIDEATFFKLVKTGFQHKRKTLSNNLATSQPTTNDEQRTTKSKSELRNIFEDCDLNPKVRAEKLTLNDWKCLLKSL